MKHNVIMNMGPRITKKRKTSHSSSPSILPASSSPLPAKRSQDSISPRKHDSLSPSAEDEAESKDDEEEESGSEDSSSEVASAEPDSMKIEMKGSSRKRSLHGEDDGDNDTDSEGSSANGNDKAVKTRSSTGERHKKLNGIVPLSNRSREVLETQPRVETARLLAAECSSLLQSKTVEYSKSKSSVEQTLRALKKLIDDIPPEEEVPIEEAERRLLRSHKIVIPFPKPRPPVEAMYKLAYTKPVNINVVGSYTLQTATRQEEPLAIDLLVTMPFTLFTEKDYLNYRYFYKRAYYLARIAAAIQSSTLEKQECLFSYHNDNPLHPIIVVRFQDFNIDGGVAEINIMLATESNTFALAKTLPNKNSIRVIPRAETKQDLALSSTSFYNASVRSDSVVTEYAKLFYQISEQCQGFRGACILGRLWLKQRGFSSSLNGGGYGHFEWAVTMALLFESDESRGRPALLYSYSIVELFVTTLRFLIIRNLASNPLLGGMTSLKGDRDPALPMIFDSERGMNILYKMSPWSYRRLQYEASQSMRIITNGTVDVFKPLFQTNVEEPFLRYDLLFKLHEEAAQRSDLPHAEARKIFEILRQGLGKRINLLNISFTKSQPWSINTARPKRLDETPIMIELEVNPQEADKSVHRGPHPDDKTAVAKFREFWGQKAELRRFGDGSIVETVVWKGKTARDKTIKIVRHLLKTHMPPKSSESLVVVGVDMRKLMGDIGVKGEKFPEQLLRFQAFKDFEDVIRDSSPDLPLAVREIKYCGFDITTADKDDPNILSVTVQFEGSGKWPSNLAAIQVTKTAFLLKMSEQLSLCKPKFECQIGLENEYQETTNKSFLDVSHFSGVILRVRIHHEHELFLIQNQLKDRNMSAGEKELASEALSDYKRRFQQRPIQQQAVQVLFTRFHAFNSTLALTKAWFDAHLLSWHFEDPLIENIVAYSFLSPFPWKAPLSPVAGFLRVLSFLAQWNWKDYPLIVDYSSSLKQEQRNEILAKFAAWRTIDPLRNRIALFIATNFDHDGTTWTTGNPSKVVAARMTELAKAACKVVRDKSVDLLVDSLFKSTLKDYDFVIQLSPRFCNFTTESPAAATSSQKYKNLQFSEGTGTRVGERTFVVNSFLRELRALYGKFIVFFHNRSGGEHIAGIWNPEYEKRNWKVSLTYSTIPKHQAKPNGEGSEVAIAMVNKQAILGEISRIGGDMITSITINK